MVRLRSWIASTLRSNQKNSQFGIECGKEAVGDSFVIGYNEALLDLMLLNHLVLLLNKSDTVSKMRLISIVANPKVYC